MGTALGVTSTVAASYANRVNPFTGNKIIAKSHENIGIPKDWVMESSKKGGGVRYTDPENPHNSIRIMPGNPNSANPAQQKAYVIYRNNGVVYDVNGLPLSSGNQPRAHIPLKMFNLNKMPQ